MVQCPYCKQTVTPAKNSLGQLVCPLCNNTGRPVTPTWSAPASAAPTGAVWSQREKLPGALPSLVCGILGIVVPYVGFILAIVAIVMGKKAKALAQQEPTRYEGEGMAKAGFILGIVALVLGALTILLAAVVFVLVSNLSDGGNSTQEILSALAHR